MKKALLITIVIVLAAAAYLYYDGWYRQSVVNITSLVPQNAAVVFESNNTTSSFKNLLKTDIWNSVKDIAEVESLNDNFGLVDSMILDKITDEEFLISAHVTGEEAFSYIFYLDVKDRSIQDVMHTALNELQNRQTFVKSKRLYNGVEIHEINHKPSALVFSYFIYDNIFIGSYTPYLIEDVVRNVNTDFKQSFFATNSALVTMPKLVKDDGNIYVNFLNMDKLVRAFTARDLDAQIGVSQLGQAAFLDVSFSANTILMNGFTRSGGGFLRTFHNQTPVADDFKYYIPTTASLFFKTLVSDGASWHHNLIDWWKVNEPAFFTARQDYHRKVNFDYDKLYSSVDKGLALVDFHELNSTNKLIVLSVKDVNEVLNQLNSFGESIVRSEGDTVYYEGYANYEIREIRSVDFPKYCFGPMYEGFEETYYTVVGKHVLMANQIETIKNTIGAIENENTWGRSVIYNEFLSKNIEEVNYSLTYNLSRYWSTFVRTLSPKWQKFFETNSGSLKSLKLGSIGFSKIDDSFYTSLIIQHDRKKVDKTPESTYYTPLQQLTFDRRLLSKPYVVKNHINNSLEVALQDSAYNFILLSAEGKKLWADSIGAPIISEVQQVDYYNNGKLQYFFATRNQLHIIDRLGNTVDDYPLTLEVDIASATVVDYDNSKRYRFLIADATGNLYLYNKRGINLEGWTPRSVGERLGMEPFHLRVRGKDMIIAITQRGIVHAMNRRGEAMPGFPLDLEVGVESSPFVTIGADLEKTEMSIVSKDGHLIVINLIGDILSNDQLYKHSNATSFELITDALNKTFVIASQDKNRLVIMDRKGKEILAKDYLHSDKMTLQYYHFSPDNQVFVVNDQLQNFTYLYDIHGVLINSRPLDSSEQVGIIYSDAKRQYTIFAVSGDTFKKLTFQ